ncbi:hypothetical protein [Brevundimonas sp.]|uniref:hypothetical protein n=1 Tax=Brevundimonas sp. TaxID=1871086 RepID=UPI0028A00EB7|nr:hypothetical protein [Brevundimonas sp.]
MNQVERVSRAVTRIFEDACELLYEDIRDEIARASADESLLNGRTVKRFARAFEARATQAVAQARRVPDYGRSTIIRVQVAKDAAAGTQRMSDMVARKLEALTLGGRSADAALSAARDRSLREPIIRPKRQPLPRWAAWAGNHIVTALLSAGVTLVAAYLIFRFGWN